MTRLPRLALARPVALLSLLTLAAATLPRAVPWHVTGPAVPRAGALALTAEPRHLSAPLRPAQLAGPRTSAMRTARAIPVHLALMHRELGHLAFGDLPFGPRQRGANEPAMHGPLVFGRRAFL
jgi:hypothetical protein